MLACSRRRSSDNAGFSLTEMLITVLIVVITAVMVLPAMHDVFLNTRLSVHVNDWLAANRFAREQAIRRGKLVTICRSAHADSGRNACDDAQVEDWAANDWATGWVVFVEGAESGLGLLDAGDEVLHRQAPLPKKVHGSASIKKISYNATGEPIGTIAGLHIRFNFDGENERIVCMTRTGRARVIQNSSRCS
ncbi:MAG: Type fimbrial biosis protein FimT [Pseudomonadota bacterium]